MLSCHCVTRFVKGPRRLSWIFEQDRRISVFLQAGSHSWVCQKAHCHRNQNAECGTKSYNVTWAGCRALRNLHRTLAPKGRHLTCHPEMHPVYLTFCHVLSTSSLFKFVLNTFGMQNLAFPLAMLSNAWIADGYRFDDRKLAVPGDSWNAHSIQGWRLGEPNISKSEMQSISCITNFNDF